MASHRPSDPLAAAERWLDSARYLADQIGIADSRASDTSIHGVTVGALRVAYAAARYQLVRRLSALDSVDLSGDAARAAERIRAVVPRLPSSADTAARPAPRAAECDDASPVPRLDVLAPRVFACYGAAAGRIEVDGQTLDRLTILGLLGEEEASDRRERLFRALAPVWQAVNGDDAERSPYRELVALRRQANVESVMADRARRFGVEPSVAEAWLVAALAGWQAALPDTLFEPWDYYHFTGLPGRRLGPRVPFDSLLALDHRFYRSLGADPVALGIRYDIEPREGKYPIAFTDFGARGIERHGRWVRGEFWVFASYRRGGLDNLAELLHETGHGIHLAAIRARPAFNDWPDADPFTEGVADLATLEIYEPAWQQAWLGDSVPLGQSLAAKYGSVMLDMAWALFEIRVHRAGAPSPNVVWTDLTTRYLRIRPHPELSWWAMRGQLIESPGYMLNYALGAFLVADLRAEIARRYGHISRGNAAWYGRVSEQLLRFGAAQPAREVVKRFLGRSPGPDALLADLRRIRSP